ncbi:Na+/H+ antiporter NhaA [Micropruina sonneratiae]|uniref:Na+/H+ antiporter NhaA n=1 Tax=Micropruina sonneratiae TaxID=2986940 RepID=UPI0022279BD4|nr:Na+/H+ antiporter NhaA [Micropruina sp. KQZ13P-5]MCW3159071.1 Na+/H+ antiporter NhaA [Micropruina sp. KQZ13P-5]
MTVTATPTRFARLARWLADEVHGGVLLLVAAVLAVVWSNSPWAQGYEDLSHWVLGWEPLHLDLSLAHWASDGLLAIFFFVVGVELKHEVVAGSLRHPKEAAVPVLAAVGGMVLPALLFLAIVLGTGSHDAVEGWAIPTATDIAFALAVLAVFGRGLPRALRVFLLTLAVVDDLLAIIVIAVVYTDHIDLVTLGCALAAIVVYGVLVRLRRTGWWVLVPVGVVAWGFMHASGVHATVAAVLCGFCVPALVVHGEDEPRTHRYDEAVRPLSTGVALPVFAFFAAGVSLSGSAGGSVFWAVLVGLVAGKVLGVLGVTALVTTLTPLRLPDAIGLRDLLPVGFLTGIGFTVSLLITELSFEGGEHLGAAKVGILAGSLLAGVLGAVLLRWDAHRARDADMNVDGVPDVDTGVID